MPNIDVIASWDYYNKISTPKTEKEIKQYVEHYVKPKVEGRSIPAKRPPPKSVETVEMPQKPTISAELRSLIAQGIPIEKAVQLIQEKYCVRAEVRRGGIPTFTHAKIEHPKHELSPLERAEFEIAKKRVELEAKGDVAPPHERLLIGAQLAGLGLASGLVNIAESTVQLAKTFAKSPIEGGKQLVTGTIEWIKSVPQRVKMGFTTSPFFAGQIAGEIGVGIAAGEALGRIVPEARIRLPTERITQYKPVGTIIEVGEARTIVPKAPTPVEIAKVAVKDVGKVKEVKPVSALMIESGLALQRGEGIGLARTAMKLGYEMKTEKPIESIRVTTLYKNLLGKRAMLTTEFTPETIKIVGKKEGGEAKGIGMKVVETFPVRSQEVTEKPTIRLFGAKEYVPKEEPVKVIDLRKLVGEEMPKKAEKVEKPKEVKVEVGKGVEQIVKAQEEHAKPLRVMDVLKEVRAIEKVITKGEKIEVGLAPPMVFPPAVTPMFAPPSMSLAYPTPAMPTVATTMFSPPEVGGLSVSPALQLGEIPKFGEFAVPELGIGLAQTAKEITKSVNIPTVGELATPIEGLAEMAKSVEVETPKMEAPKVSTPKVTTPAFTPPISMPSIVPPPIPTGLPWLGGGIQGISRPPGKKKGKKGKKAYIGLLAGYTEVTLTEMLTGRKAKHLMVPEVMVGEWLTTLRTGGMIEVPTFEEITGELRKGWRI